LGNATEQGPKKKKNWDDRMENFKENHAKKNKWPSENLAADCLEAEILNTRLIQFSDLEGGEGGGSKS